MQIDPNDVHPKDIYFTMISCIAPRPIAWVSTLSSSGVSNLAPFSYFTGLTSKPPTLLFCPGNKPGGEKKDTLRNIEDTGEFVVNVVPYDLAQQMNATSADFDREVSEFKACGVEAGASLRVKPSRVVGAHVHFECKLHQAINVGDGNIVIGEILLIDVDDSVLDGDGRIDADKLDLVGRMGGLSYAHTRERFELPRPPKP